MSRKITIPLYGEKYPIVIYPDELAEYDELLLLNALQAELSPLTVWKECAVEFHRQSLDGRFYQILQEIAVALEDDNIVESYKAQHADFAEQREELFATLAAKSLTQLIQAKDNTTRDKLNAQIVDYLRKCEDNGSIGEYVWLIRGFVEIQNENWKRALDSFKFVLDRANSKNQEKKKFLFGALVGLAVISYSQSKYQEVIDYLTKAIQAYPSSQNTSLRTAYAICCFKLEQYNRAHDAIDAALSLDPSNADVLVVKALLLQVGAVKCDKQKKSEYRQEAYENCMLAYTIDPTHSLAMLQIANHLFYTWKIIHQSTLKHIAHTQSHVVGNICSVVDTRTIKLHLTQIPLHTGDLLRFNHHHKIIYTIVSITPQLSDQSMIITLNRDILFPPNTNTTTTTTTSNTTDKDVPFLIEEIEICELSQVIQLCNDAIYHIKLKGNMNEDTYKETVHERVYRDILAEGYYILGKVYHIQGYINEGLEYYLRSLKNANMMLSAYHVAQIYVSRKDFSSALTLFEQIHLKYPTDKNTQAFIYFLKSILKKELFTYEILKDITIGFQFEIDLWTLQGQLRFGNSSEYPTALKCLQHAIQCIQDRVQEEGGGSTDGEGGEGGVPSSLYSNISILYHHMGKIEDSVTHIRLAIQSERKQLQQNNTTNNDTVESDTRKINPVFQSAELEGYYYTWASSPLCTVTYDLHSDIFTCIDTNLTENIHIGDRIKMDSIIYEILSVDNHTFTATSGIPMSSLYSEQEIHESTFPIYIKERGYNFHSNITNAYNLARIYEDYGSYQTSIEVYTALIQSYPDFTECYLRLAEIYGKVMGNTDMAITWLQQALSIDSNHPDTYIAMGDMYSLARKYDLAKKSYEKVCAQNRHDARAMISLGNFYYNSLKMEDTTRYENNVKDAYKFYHSILIEDTKNMYASIGLGMIFAEKKMDTAAKEIFTKLREEVSLQNVDVSINLAHMHLAQGRYSEAEHLYQSVLKTVSMTNTSTTPNCIKTKLIINLYEWISLSQSLYKHYADGIRALQHAIHLDPTMVRIWYNISILNRDYALELKNKVGGYSVDEIQIAYHSIDHAYRLFTFLLKCASSSSASSSHIVVKKEIKHYSNEFSKSCKDIRSQIMTLMTDAVKNKKRQDYDRRKKEEELNKWKEEKQQLQLIQQHHDEDQVLLLKERAYLKQKQLEEMKEKWSFSTMPEKRGDGNSGKKGSKSKSKFEDSLYDEDHEGGGMDEYDREDSRGGGGGEGGSLELSIERQSSKNEVVVSKMKKGDKKKLKKKRKQQQQTDELFGDDDDDDDEDDEDEDDDDMDFDENKVVASTVTSKRDYESTSKGNNKNDEKEDDKDDEDENIAPHKRMKLMDEDNNKDTQEGGVGGGGDNRIHDDLFGSDSEED